MKLRNLFALLVAVAALFLFVGCQPASSGGGSGGGGGDADQADQGGGDGAAGTDDGAGGDDGTDGTAGQNDNQGDSTEPDANDNADAGDTGNDNSDDTTDDDQLTDEQEEAVNDVLLAYEAIAGLFAALGDVEFPSAGEGPVVIGQDSGCPTVTLDQGQVVIDYGEGCSPALYPDLTVAGSISGKYDAQEGTISLTFNDFLIDGESVDGTITGSLSEADNVLTTEGTVALAFSGEGYEFSVTGDATVHIDLDTGEVTIESADLTVSDDGGDSYSVTLIDVHSDPADNSNFLPDSGTAAITFDEGGGETVLSVTFTAQTPVDGTVIVQVDNLPPITVSVEDIMMLLE